MNDLDYVGILVHVYGRKIIIMEKIAVNIDTLLFHIAAIKHA